MSSLRFARFGPFELRVRTGELYKYDTRIRLRDQSLQVLLMLIERPGEVVLRSEIQLKLWPSETLVEFNKSINAAVSGLRTALGDSGSQPVYVETMVKRGYRFLAEVELIQEPLPEPLADNLAPVFSPAEIPSVDFQPPEPASPKPDNRRGLWTTAGVLILILAVGVWGWMWKSGSRQPLPPTRTVALTNLAGMSRYPSFSPDGEKIVFSWVGPPRNDSKWRRLNLYIQPVGNGDPIRITEGPADDIYAQWSPDGSRIAFQRNTESGHELRMVSVGGGPDWKIADMADGLSWSPDGTQLAYTASKTRNGSDGVVIRSLKTGSVRQLTDPKSGQDSWVGWSPDGNWIAFSRAFSETARDLFIVPISGGAARQLTFDRTAMAGFAWTPSSGEIVFASNRQGQTSRLWRIPVEGGTPSPVDTRTHIAVEPAISLKGTRLAFREGYSDSNIWQYGAVGPARAPGTFSRSPKCLICSAVLQDTPRYSPDGRKIVFVSQRSGYDEIWVSDSDGGYPVRLTSTQAFSGSPRWSPDGRWIAFDAQKNGNPHIFLIGAEGGTLRQLTSDPSGESMPSWSHDGRWIYFASSRGGHSRVWKVPLAGGDPVQVTNIGGGESMETPDGRRLYYWGNGLRLWTVPIAGGTEEMVPEMRDVIKTRAWTVRSEGIYFYQDGKQDEAFIRFLSFATHKVTTVLQPLVQPIRYRPGMDISPDGRTLLYTQTDHRIEGLFAVENFH